MQRSRYVKIAVVATNLFVLPLLLIASGCSTHSTNSSEPTIASNMRDTPTPVSGPQPNSNGAMVRANVHGTGVYVTKGVRELTGARWSIKPTIRGSITTPAIQGSVVYFGRDGLLYAVDAETGTEKWNYKLLDNPGTSAPAVAGDTVYVGGWEVLYALSTDTGEVKWLFRPGSGSDDRYFIDPIVDDGTVYFGGWNSLYALDSETGREKWMVKLSGITRSIPTLYDGTIYMGTFSPDDRDAAYLYALDSKTGQEKWKFKATSGGIGGAVAVTDGVVYVNISDDGLLALDARSGQEKWRYNADSDIVSAPAVAYGTVHITGQGGLYAIDAQTGKEKWRFQASGGLYSDPVIADGIIYFGSTTENIGAIFGGQLTSYLYAVDANSGQELWKFSVQGIASTAPAVSDGTVYFGSEEGEFYAVR